MQDIDYLAEQLARLHPNLFFRTPCTEFDALVNEVRRAVPSRSDAEVAVSLLRIAAVPGDGHTSLSFPPGPDRLDDLPEALALPRKTLVLGREGGIGHAPVYPGGPFNA